jgi:hypothetical protein
MVRWELISTALADAIARAVANKAVQRKKICGAWQCELFIIGDYFDPCQQGKFARREVELHWTPATACAGTIKAHRVFK